MSASLNFILQTKFPSITIGENQQVEIVNYGQGDVIKIWNVPNIAQPSLDDINTYAKDINIQASWQAYLNEYTNGPILQQLNDLDNKSIRALRTADTQRLSQYETQAANLRAQLLPMTAAGVIAAGFTGA